MTITMLLYGTEFDDVPSKPKFLSSTSNLGTGSSNDDDSVEKRHTRAVKRPFDDIDNNSFHASVKKPKRYVRKKVSKPFSMRMKEDTKRLLELVENSIAECKKKRSVEEQKLHSLEKDVDECSKELQDKKKKATRVRRINEYYKNKQIIIEIHVKDLAAKETQVCLIEDSIIKHTYERKKNEIELLKVKDTNDKDGGRKEVETLSQKINECTKEIKIKKEELDALKILFSGRVEKLRSERHKLMNAMDKMDKRRTDQHDQMKDSAPMKKQFEGRATKLDERERQCDQRLKELNSKEIHFEVQAKELESKEFESKQEEFEDRVKDFESKEEEFEGQVKELEIKKKHFESQLKELGLKDKLFERRVNELESKKKHVEGQMKELELKEKHLEGRVKEFKLKEHEFEGRVKELESEKKHFEIRVKEFKTKEAKFQGQVNDLESKKKHLERQVKELNSKEKQLEGRVIEFESKEGEFQGLVKKHESRKKHFERQVKELESKEKQFGGRLKEVESEKKHFENQVEELKSKEQQIEGLVKEMVSKEQQLEGQLKEFELKEREFKGQLKELESEKKHFESQLKELKSKENQFEGRVKEFESKQVNFDDQMKELGTKMNDFEGRVKELNTKQNLFESRVKELGSKLKQYEGQVKEFQSKKEAFKGQMREFKSKEKDFESRVREFESKEEECKGRVRECELKRLELQLKELKSKENKFEGQVKDLESMHNEFSGQLNELELRENQYETLIKSFEEEIESDDQLSPTIDGRNLQLSFEQVDEQESHDSDILVNLLASSDPSKLVLDIIQNPTIPRCEEYNDFIIDGSHIVLLEQLMRISPHVKPDVREEATKLALNLKAYIDKNTENSVAALGFLLLLSIYGLVSFFDKEEVLNLFGSVARHKITVELFGTMGFADKISDFVHYLIRKKQHVEAVRFICGYNMANKNQSSVDLLREHVQSAKVISESNCRKTNSVEIKDKARDQEIATLGTVLQCILDNNIESVDLLNQIQGRILKLNRQKGK